MTNTCKTCKHFEWEEWNPKEYGSCKRWHKGYDQDRPKLASNEVIVEDDEGWGMMMGPDFGCVLHEAITVTMQQEE